MIKKILFATFFIILAACAVNNQFVSHFSIKSTPQIDSFEKHITENWEVICDECNKEMRSVKFKMKFKKSPERGTEM